MVIQDTSQIKERIMSLLRIRGPSLPVHIAREIGMSILFSSAFLSEMVSDGRIKISNTKVGNSPLYLIQGQEFMLERFSNHLKTKEKEAFELLRNKKILKDKEQEPSIKVALRNIKDYAIPFKKKDEIYWRYFRVGKEEIREMTEKEDVKMPIEKEKELDIFDSGAKKDRTENIRSSRSRKKPKKTSQKKDELFFNRVKEYLSKKSARIIGIESFNKNELYLRIGDKGEEKLLAAFNKKRITENDIIKASKKASEINMKYAILSLGEPLKRLKNLIDALNGLSEIERINQ